MSPDTVGLATIERTFFHYKNQERKKMSSTETMKVKKSYKSRSQEFGEAIEPYVISDYHLRYSRLSGRKLIQCLSQNEYNVSVAAQRIFCDQAFQPQVAEEHDVAIFSVPDFLGEHNTLGELEHLQYFLNFALPTAGVCFPLRLQVDDFILGGLSSGRFTSLLIPHLPVGGNRSSMLRINLRPHHRYSIDTYTYENEINFDQTAMVLVRLPKLATNEASRDRVFAISESLSVAGGYR